MSTDRFEEELPDGLKALETALRGLQPMAMPIDRDRLMYLAGQTSASRSSASQTNSISAGAAPARANRFRFVWPLATAVSIVVSLVLAGRVHYLSGVAVRSAIAERPATQGPPSVAIDSMAGGPVGPRAREFSSPSVGESNYVQLRNAVLDRGVDALPASSANSVSAASQKVVPRWPTLRDDLLGG
jgi:hypothetical protein